MDYVLLDYCARLISLATESYIDFLYAAKMFKISVTSVALNTLLKRLLKYTALVQLFCFHTISLRFQIATLSFLFLLFYSHLHTALLDLQMYCFVLSHFMGLYDATRCWNYLWMHTWSKILHISKNAQNKINKIKKAVCPTCLANSTSYY